MDVTPLLGDGNACNCGQNCVRNVTVQFQHGNNAHGPLCYVNLSVNIREDPEAVARVLREAKPASSESTSLTCTLKAIRQHFQSRLTAIGRPALKKLAGVVLLWAVCLGIHQCMTVLTYYRGTQLWPDTARAPPLHDLLHELLPNWQAQRAVAEVGTAIPVLLLGVFVVYHTDARAVAALQMYLLAHGSLMVLRAFLFTATLLPDPSQHCTDKEAGYSGSCFDLIFSGHVVVLTLAVLCIWKYFLQQRPSTLTGSGTCTAPNRLHGAATYVTSSPPQSPVSPVVEPTSGEASPLRPWPHRARRVLIVVLVCLQILMPIVIIATRNHYTVDVLLSLMITPVMLSLWRHHPLLQSIASVPVAAGDPDPEAIHALNTAAQSTLVEQGHHTQVKLSGLDNALK